MTQWFSAPAHLLPTPAPEGRKGEVTYVGARDEKSPLERLWRHEIHAYAESNSSNFWDILPSVCLLKVIMIFSLIITTLIYEFTFNFSFSFALNDKFTFFFFSSLHSKLQEFVINARKLKTVFQNLYRDRNSFRFIAISNAFPFKLCHHIKNSLRLGLINIWISPTRNLVL